VRTIANRRDMICLLLLNAWIRSSLGRGNISPATPGALAAGPKTAERRGTATSASAWRAFSAVRVRRCESLGREELRRSRALRSSEQTEPHKSHKRSGFPCLLPCFRSERSCVRRAVPADAAEIADLVAFRSGRHNLPYRTSLIGTNGTAQVAKTIRIPMPTSVLFAAAGTACPTGLPDQRPGSRTIDDCRICLKGVGPFTIAVACESVS
jgi:hypothetical protein